MRFKGKEGVFSELASVEGALFFNSALYLFLRVLREL